MRLILDLAGRNLKVYLRDRAAVFFSLLSVFIIIGLYAFFLGDTNVRSIEGMAGNASRSDVRWLVDSWIMAGILVVNGITVSLGVFGVMIDDESRKRLHGFLVAPIRRSQLVAGYLIAANVAGLLLSLVALFLAELYIGANGGSFLTAGELLKVIGLILLNVLSSSSLVFLMVSFIRTASGFSTLSTILGTIIGFLTGIYVPIGVLPEFLQTIIKFVPASHTAALMRQVFMERPLEAVFSKAPAGLATEYQTIFGVIVSFNDKALSQLVMLLIVIGSGLVFLGLSVFRMNRRKIG